MSDKCTHDSTIVEYDGGNVQVERCTWACGQTLISVKKTNGVTVTMTYQELAALTERVAELEASNARLFDDLHNQIHQTVGAEMERDELREQVADVNELLWEFAENPNIELGEKGHSKIEDYFKKYTKQEAQ